MKWISFLLIFAVCILFIPGVFSSDIYLEPRFWDLEAEDMRFIFQQKSFWLCQLLAISMYVMAYVRFEKAPKELEPPRIINPLNDD